MNNLPEYPSVGDAVAFYTPNFVEGEDPIPATVTGADEDLLDLRVEPPDGDPYVAQVVPLHRGSGDGGGHWELPPL